MKKYLKMIPVILYPYAYLILLGLLFVKKKALEDFAQNISMEDNFLFWLIVVLVYHFLVIFVVIYNLFASFKGKYILYESAKINMITKCLQIPAYIFHFILGLLGLLMSVWGIGVILFAIIIDFITISLTSISSLGLLYKMKKEDVLTKKQATICLVCSFIYCLDVVISIFCYIVTKRKYDDNTILKSVIKEKRVKTKYPILLLHGMGFRDFKSLNYWGRIPATLKANGYEVYYGMQDAVGTVEDNAKKIKEEIERLSKEHNIEKFNVIAHSKGGLDIRFAISSLHIGDKIASVTTISTPHNGSKTIDKLLKFPEWIIKMGCRITDIVFRFCGDQKPNTYAILKSFKTQDADKFNKENKDDERVLYQSYAFIMSKSTSDMAMWFSHLFVKAHEGENDGLLTPESVKWGNFKGIYKGVNKRGISHYDEVDFRRRPFSEKESENEYEVADITTFYLDVAHELAIKYNL